MQESTAGPAQVLLITGHVNTSTMLKEQLVNQEDLLETLDTEPIFDYLLQHGVLDKTTIDGICNEKTPKERNTALLRHLEGNGNNAVALFINALRQSGQLHLASTLDVSQRIKPIYGTGYWEKQRHKGQVVVKIEVKAIKILAPSEETPQKHQRPPREVYDVKMTPRRLHKSYDNMLMLDAEEQSTPKAIRIIDYPYAKDDDEEDEPIKPKTSCWCMCFPMFRSRRKTDKGKKYADKEKNTKTARSPSHESKQNSRQASPTKHKYNSPSRRSSSGLTNSGEKPHNGHSHSRTNSPLKDSQIEYKNSVNERRTVYIRSPENKENMDPVIMRYNERLQLVELKRYSTKGSPKENGLPKTVMCEMWKSDGKHYEEKSSEFYGLFERDLKNSCIKYFEQDRGTLILQIFSDNQGITVFNICMTKDQVSQLREDYKCGKLQEKLKTILIATGTIERLDILDINLAITIDDNQFEEATQELT